MSALFNNARPQFQPLPPTGILPWISPNSRTQASLFGKEKGKLNWATKPLQSMLSMIKKISLVLGKIVENYIRLFYQNRLPGPLDSTNQCVRVCGSLTQQLWNFISLWLRPSYHLIVASPFSLDVRYLFWWVPVSSYWWLFSS